MSIKTFYVSPKRVTRFLFFMATGLTTISFAASCIKNGFDIVSMAPLEVGNDSSLPTWYSSFALLICALLLALITAIKRKAGDTYTYYWFFLSALFFYISIDEVATLRETLDTATPDYLGGIFYHTWTVVGIPFVIIFAVIYLKFLASLPKDTKRLFAVAGGVFVLGAVGVEMLASLINSQMNSTDYSTDSMLYTSMLYDTVTTFEEYFEMLGVIIFIYALLLYLTQQNIKGVQIHIEEDLGHLTSLKRK